MTAAVATLLSPQALQAHALELLERDGWSRERLLEYQRVRLRSMIEHAVERSEYYCEALGPDAADADLSDLPTLPKSLLVDEFERGVTDPRARRRGLEAFRDWG